MSTAREATTHLADLLRREHHALAEFLLALATFDRERRWTELAYPSLFAFLNRELGLSKAAAYYRLTAARLVQQHPAVVEPLLMPVNRRFTQVNRAGRRVRPPRVRSLRLLSPRSSSSSPRPPS